MSLPVVLREGQRLERALTANVSHNGLAIICERKQIHRRPMQVEVVLPNGVQLAGHATIMRTATALFDRGGRKRRGIGLRVDHWTGQSHSSWVAYLGALRDEKVRSECCDAASVLVTATPPLAGASTFMLQPRTLGHLRNFYNHEMARGEVRIETDVVRTVGSPVELTVDHPNTDTQWTLHGEVSAVRLRVGRQKPVLEVRLKPMSTGHALAFQKFIGDSDAGHSQIDSIVLIPSVLLDATMPGEEATEAPDSDQNTEPNAPFAAFFQELSGNESASEILGPKIPPPLVDDDE